jgi:hypothetical protein
MQNGTIRVNFMKILRAVSVVLIIILVISSVSCTDPSNGETDTTGPTIIVDDFNLSEGETITINATVTDQSGVKTVNIQNENYTFISNFSDPNYTVTAIPIDPNFNGTTIFTISAEDNNGNKSSITKTIYVQPTPDLVFYDMPDSISMIDGETKTVNGKIEDDYSTLENITLTPSCSHATVFIDKIGGDVFKLYVDTNQGFIGNSEITISASDEEGNSNSYSISLTINTIPNENPRVTAPASVSFNEGQAYSFNIDVSDDRTNIEDMIFTGINQYYNAQFVQVDSNTMRIDLNPKTGCENYNGTNNLEITVEDSDGGSTTANVILNVNDTPDLRFYDMPVSVSMQDGETKTVNGKIEDDYSTLANITLTPSCNYATIQINKLTGDSFEIIIIADHPETGINERDSGFTGETTLEIQAGDEEGNSNSYSIPLTINEIPNENPEITAPTSVDFDEGQNYSFNIDVSDDNDSIDDLIFIGNCTQYDVGFVKVDSNTMRIDLSPKTGYENYNGTTNLEIIVEDSDGGSTTANVTLNVNDTPDLRFYDMPVSVSMQDGETKTVNGKIEDDYSTLANITLTPFCSHATVQINKLTGESFEIIIIADQPETKMNERDSGFTGETTIEIQASDEEGNSNSYSIPLTIDEIPNNAPTITAPTSVDFNEGQDYSFNIDVSDDRTNIEDMIFTGTNQYYNAQFVQVDSNTMRVNLSPKIGQENYNGTTNLEIIVEDSDGGSTTENVTLNVNNTPDLRFYDMPDLISMIDGETKTVNGKIEDDYSALENITLSPSCSHATVQINKLTGDSFEIIIIADRPETEMNERDSGFTGETTVEIQASDEEGNSNSYSIPLTINEIPNENPEITGPTSVNFDEGQNYSFNIDVSDDNDSIDDLIFTGSCIQYDVCFVKVDSNTMRIDLSPKTGYENYNGTTNLEIIVEDSDGGSTTANVTLDVNDTPDLVFYDMPDPISMIDGETKTVNGKIEDDYSALENITLTPSCSHATVQINKLTGDSFEIIIIADHPETGINERDSGFTGETTIKIQASDEEGNSNSYFIPLTINEIPNENPQVTAPASVSFNEGRAYSFNIDVSDDNDSIDDLIFIGICTQYDVGFVKIDSNTMRIDLSPKTGYENYNGTTNLEIIVEDSDGGSTTENVTLNVNDTPDLVFYDMPDSISMIDGETKTVNGKIEDDYSALANITLSPSCSHATVQINKLTGDSFEIIIIADRPETEMNRKDSGFTGETTVEIQASDEEGNNATYTVPVTISGIPNNAPTLVAPELVNGTEGQRTLEFTVLASDLETPGEQLDVQAASSIYDFVSQYLGNEEYKLIGTLKDGMEEESGPVMANIWVKDQGDRTAFAQTEIVMAGTQDIAVSGFEDNIEMRINEVYTDRITMVDDDKDLYNPKIEVIPIFNGGEAEFNPVSATEGDIEYLAETEGIHEVEVYFREYRDIAKTILVNETKKVGQINVLPAQEMIDINLDLDGVLLTYDNDGIVNGSEVHPDMGEVILAVNWVPITNYNLAENKYTPDYSSKEAVIEPTRVQTSSEIDLNLEERANGAYEIIAIPTGDWQGWGGMFDSSWSQNIGKDFVFDNSKKSKIAITNITNNPNWTNEPAVGGSEVNSPRTSAKLAYAPSELTMEIVKTSDMTQYALDGIKAGLGKCFPGAGFAEYPEGYAPVSIEGKVVVMNDESAWMVLIFERDTNKVIAAYMGLPYGAANIQQLTLAEGMSIRTQSAEIPNVAHMDFDTWLCDGDFPDTMDVTPLEQAIISYYLDSGYHLAANSTMVNGQLYSNPDGTSIIEYSNSIKLESGQILHSTEPRRDEDFSEYNMGIERSQLIRDNERRISIRPKKSGDANSKYETEIKYTQQVRNNNDRIGSVELNESGEEITICYNYDGRKDKDYVRCVWPIGCRNIYEIIPKGELNAASRISEKEILQQINESQQEKHLESRKAA